MEPGYDRVDSFQEALQTVQDEYLPQAFEEAENFQVGNNVMMYSPHTFEGTPLQAMEYCEEQRGMKRRRSDSTNLSLGSGSSDEPEWMREQLLEGAEQPLPHININSTDLPDTENANQFQIGRMPPVIQQADVGGVSHWVNTSQNPAQAQMWNDMNPPQLQASNTAQRNVCDSATRIPAIPIAAEMIPNAPPYHHLELSVGYQEFTSIKKRLITGAGGFLLFHEKTPNPSQLPGECEFIPFPNPPVAEGTISGKNLNYIGKVLANLQGGLQIRCHEGCIYATRRSKAKIFYRTGNMHSSSSELPRNKEIMIFNGKQCISTILDKYLKQENCEEAIKSLNPTIYFSFAQKWVPEATWLKSMLVWAKLVPHTPQYVWDGFFHAKENSKQKSLSSISSDLLKVSLEHSGEGMTSTGRM